MDRDILKKIKFERYTNLSSLKKEKRDILISALRSILKDAWGEFPQNFIEEHILKNENTIIFALLGKYFIGFCVLSHRNILNKNISYVEFLVIRKAYQKSRIGSRLTYLILRKDFLRATLRIPPKALDVMFITPNIVVLASTVKFCSFIYPNPYLSDENGKILPADETTFRMAEELIKKSDNSTRVINRDGLVLENSYNSTPWLIYREDNAPKHSDKRINKFAIKYLEYGSGADKEFIIVAKITAWSFVGSLLKK